MRRSINICIIRSISWSSFISNKTFFSISNNLRSS